MAITWTDYMFPLEGIADTDERLAWYKNIGLDEDFDIIMNLEGSSGTDRFWIIPNNDGNDRAMFNVAGMHNSVTAAYQFQQRFDRIVLFLDGATTSNISWTRSTSSNVLSDNITFSKGSCKNNNIHIWRVLNSSHDTYNYNRPSALHQCMIIIDKSATNADGNTVSYYFIGGGNIMDSNNCYILRALLSDSELNFNFFQTNTSNDNQFPDMGGTSNIMFTDKFIFRQIVRSGVKGIFYYLDGGRNNKGNYIPRPVEFRAAGHDWISLGDRIVAKVD